MRQLLDSGYDFNWLNDQAILAAGIKDKALVVGGMPYYSLLLPQVELMPLPVLQKLDLAAKAGVKIIWHGTVPRLGATESEHEPVRKLASALTTASEPIGEIPCGWGGDFSVRFAVDAKRIMVTRFHRQNRCLYLISNRTGNPLTVPMESATSNSLAIYDPATGVIENKKLPFNFELEANQSRVVIDSNPPALEPLDDTPSKVWRKPLAIGGPAKIIPINIALKAKASASSTAPGNYSVDCVLDGNRNTGTWEQWCNADNDPASADKPVWLMLEWDKPQTVKRIVLTLMESYLVSDYELQYRIKGEWKTYGDAQVKGNTQTTREHVLKSAVTTNAVRFVGKKGPANQPTIVRLIEFEVFEK